MFHVYAASVPVVIAIVSFLLLVLALIYVYLRAQAREVLRLENILLELNWKRMHRLPLVLELLPSENIIELRSRSMAEGLLSKELDEQTQELFRRGEASETVRKNAHFLALRVEFKDLFEASEQGQRSYELSLQRFAKTLSGMRFRPYLIFPSFRSLAGKVPRL